MTTLKEMPTPLICSC